MVVSETCGSVLKYFIKPHPFPFHSILAKSKKFTCLLVTHLLVLDVDTLFHQC